VYSSRAQPESELSDAWCRLRPPLVLLLPVDGAVVAHDPDVLEVALEAEAVTSSLILHRLLAPLEIVVVAFLFVTLLLISATSVSMSIDEDVEDGGLTIKVETLPVGTL